MNEFVNTYEYNDEMVKETARAYYMYRIFPKKNMLLSAVVGVMGCLLIALHKNVMALALGVGILVCLAIMAVQAMQRIDKIEAGLEASEEENGTAKGTRMTSMFCGEECLFSAGEKEPKVLPLADLKDSFESTNYYILVFNDQKIVAVRKDGFLKGSAEEFDEFFQYCPQQIRPEAMQLTGCLAALAGCSSYFLMTWC